MYVSYCSNMGPQSGGLVTSDLRDLIDRGLMAVAQNAFQEAYDCFQKACTLDSSNIMVSATTCTEFVVLIFQEKMFLPELGIEPETFDFHTSMQITVPFIFKNHYNEIFCFIN